LEEERLAHPISFGYAVETGLMVLYEKPDGSEQTETLDALEGGFLVIQATPVAEDTLPENTEPNTTEAPQQ